MHCEETFLTVQEISQTMYEVENVYASAQSESCKLCLFEGRPRNSSTYIGIGSANL